MVNELERAISGQKMYTFSVKLYESI